MKRITGGMIAFQKDGEIINFENREEYDTFIETKESKETSLLLASHEMVLESIREGKEAQIELEIHKDFIYDDLLEIDFENYRAKKIEEREEDLRRRKGGK